MTMPKSTSPGTPMSLDQSLRATPLAGDATAARTPAQNVAADMDGNWDDSASADTSSPVGLAKGPGASNSGKSGKKPRGKFGPEESNVGHKGPMSSMK